MRKILSLALLICLSGSLHAKVNRFDVLANKALVEANLTSFIKHFPLEDYKIFKVENLGRFYIDDIPDGIKWHLSRGIYWESGIGDYVRKYTRPGTIAIDLGAHIGIHTITMSRKVGQNGKVLAFEPQWKIFRELNYNLRLNNCTQNVTIFPLAVGEEEKIVEMTAPNLINEGGTSIGSGGNKA